MEYISKIGSKGEIFTPKAVRDQLDFHANQPISIIVKKNGIFVSKIRTDEEILKINKTKNVKVSYHVLKNMDSELENEL
ncbi:MAG: AbrB/MazE/SpoVT family DNA-binding domain-containing protein [Promethearchaeota archaeon]|nr:MAG: AbrB/MazE/SpoVT family DNA-binding domain-containing protein [Candidatus Lokiarchaeota archaeon]